MGAIVDPGTLWMGQAGACRGPIDRAPEIQTLSLLGRAVGLEDTTGRPATASPDELEREPE